MSKFDYGAFTGDFPIAISKQRYTEQEAIEIAKSELGVAEVEKFDGYVKLGFGSDDNGSEVRNTWWLTISHKECPKGCCPVWAFVIIERSNSNG